MGQVSQHTYRLAHLMASRAFYAECSIDDARYTPIFERLDAEVAHAEARQNADPVSRMKATVLARAMDTARAGQNDIA